MSQFVDMDLNRNISTYQHSHLAGGEQRNSSGRRMSYDKSFSFAIGHGHEEIVNLSSHDEFPLLDTDDYTPHLSPRTTLGHEASTLSSSVKKPGPEEACYPVWEGMKLLLIFNFSIIEGKEERTGSYRDVENLKRTFQDKNFEVTVFEDLTKSDVEKVLEKYRTNQDLKKISALFMIFMSHGDGKNPESFLSYDGQSINMAKDVRFFFNDENCHLLKGKPKVFHGIFCRDITDKEDTHLSSNYDESTSKLKYFNDMMTIYSCARGKKSYRDGTNGTYFVLAYCKIINIYGHMHDIYRIFAETQREMRKNSPPGDNSLEGYEPCMDPPLTFGTLYLV